MSNLLKTLNISYVSDILFSNREHLGTKGRREIMAFDIETLTGMGITPEAAEKLVCLHNSVVDGVKEELKKTQEEAEAAKADAEQAAELQARIDEQKAREEGYKAKYEAEKSALDALKAEQAEKKETERKRGAFRSLLIGEGIRPKIADLIARCADVNSYRWNAEEGTFDNPDAVKADIASEWGEYKGNAR